MAKYSDAGYSAASALGGTEYWACVQGGNTRIVSADQVKTLARAGFALDDLSNVDAATPSDGQVLAYDSSSPSGWRAETLALGATTLDGLSDVDTSGVADGDVLTYDSDSPVGWRAVPPTTGVTTLDALSDVDTTGVSDGDALVYDADSPSGWRAGKIAPSIQSVTSSATVTPTFANDQVNITAQAAGLTLANPTGTAIPAWGMVIRIKDNGTAQTIAYGTQYRAIGVTLPTTTVISKTLYLGCIWNSTDSKLDVVTVAQEA